MAKIPAVVALGMFDGVHMGHRRLLLKAAELAQRLGAQPVAFTFTNNPQTLFGAAPPVLTLPEEKAALIGSLGLQVHMEPFTMEFASQSPEGFLQKLMESYELRGIAAGFNYHFGQKRMGDAAMLQEFGRQYGFETAILEPVLVDGEPVSSTRIRKALLAGKIREANKMLQAPFFYQGTIQARRRIGRRLGFPTANLVPEGKLFPPYGVYAAEAEVEGKCYGAVANIGVRPTVDQSADPEVTVEPYLLDFDGDLYGKKMILRILDFMRPEQRFENEEELSAQIGRDARRAGVILEEFRREKSTGIGQN